MKALQSCVNGSPRLVRTPEVSIHAGIAHRPYAYAECGWWWDEEREPESDGPSEIDEATVEDDYSEDSRP